MALPQGFELDTAEASGLPSGFEMDAPQPQKKKRGIARELFSYSPAGTLAELAAGNGEELLRERVLKPGKSIAANTMSAVKMLSMPFASGPEKERLTRQIEELRDYSAQQAPDESMGGISRFARGATEMAPSMLAGGLGFANILAQAATNRPAELVMGGVDPSTATKVGLSDLATTAAMSRLPLRGATNARSILRGGLMNVAAGEGQAALGNQILGDQYEDFQAPLFDPERMGGNATMGALFGAQQFKAGAPHITPLKDLGTLAAQGISKVASPEKLYGSAIKLPLSKKWTKQLPGEEVTRRQRAVEKGLESEVPPTEFGIAKAKALEKEYKTLVDTAIADLDTTGQEIKLSELKKGINKAYAIAENSDDPVGAKRMVDKIWTKFSQRGRVVPGELVRDEMGSMVRGNDRALKPSEVQAVKRQLYKQNNYEATAQAKNLTSQLKESARKGLAHEAMTSLEEMAKGLGVDLKSLNKNDAAYIDLVEALEKAVPRIGNNDVVGLDTKVLFANDPIKAAFNATLGHPRVKAKAAFILHKASNRKLSVSEAAKRLDTELPKILKDQRGSAPVAPGYITKGLQRGKEIAGEYADALKGEITDIRDEFKDTFTKRDPTGREMPATPYRRLKDLESRIRLNKDIGGPQPKGSMSGRLKDSANNVRDALLQEIREIREEFESMYKKGN